MKHTTFVLNSGLYIHFEDNTLKDHLILIYNLHHQNKYNIL
nr:MAG TPA: hypothetical protein [Caudoviricetes sp.]